MSKPLNKPIVIEMTQPDTCHRYFRFYYGRDEYVGSGGYVQCNVETKTVLEVLLLTVHALNDRLVSSIQRRSPQDKKESVDLYGGLIVSELYGKTIRLEEVSFGEYFLFSKGLSSIARAAYESNNSIVKTYRLEEEI